MKKTKTIAASTLTVAMALSSLTGCSMLGNKVDTDAVVDATESLCGYMVDGNYKKMSKMVSEDVEEDDLEAIADYCDMIDGDNGDIIEAYLDSASYEVDEESIEAKKDNINVTVTFTLADIDSISDEEYASMEELIDAIDAADENEIEVEFTFVKDDDEYLLAEVDAISDFYSSFMDDVDDLALVIAASNGSDTSNGAIESTYWWFADENNNYDTVGDIDLQIYFAGDVDESAVSWECTYNGSVIASGTGSDAWVFATDCTGITLESQYYFPAGVYTITFFMSGEEIYSESTNVAFDESMIYDDIDIGFDFGSDGTIDVEELSFESERLQALLVDYCPENGYILTPYEPTASDIEDGITEGFYAISETEVVMALACDDPSVLLEDLQSDSSVTDYEVGSDGVITFNISDIPCSATTDDGVLLIVQNMAG